MGARPAAPSLRREPAAVAAALLAAVALASAPAAARAEAAAGTGLHPRAEWIVSGAFAAAWLAMMPALFVDATTESALGPSFRGPEDVGALEAAVAGGLLDRRSPERETVPDSHLGIMVGATLAGALAIGWGLAPWIDTGGRADGLWFAEQGLAALAGMVHAVGGTLMLTQVAKVGVGRLRPDFADRADRHYCYQDPVPATYRPRCGALEAAGTLGAPLDEADLERGRTSFWSGHAALAFASATYATLLVGGRMVWGRTASAATRPVGLLLGGAALAAAAFVAASRVTDGVHHLEDVLVGSAVGVAMACFGYFLHFEGSGEVRPGIALSAAPTEGGVALALSGAL